MARGMTRLLARQWPVVLVLAGVAGGLVVVRAVDGFRVGTLVVGGFVLVGAWLRAMLPNDRLGVLVVRSRRVDVAALGLLGLAITVLALVVPPPS